MISSLSLPGPGLGLPARGGGLAAEGPQRPPVHLLGGHRGRHVLHVHVEARPGLRGTGEIHPETQAIKSRRNQVSSQHPIPTISQQMHV